VDLGQPALSGVSFWRRMITPDAFLRSLAAGPTHVGATTAEEQAWCRWFAAEIYTAEGALVELGPWLGSLTMSLCEGLVRNPRAAQRREIAHVFDLFEWSSIFEEWSHGTPHAGRFAPGQSFEAYFRGLLGEHNRFLAVTRADLSATVWNGKPIELLINDAAKSLRIADNIFRTFVPAMIPGRSYIAHQDFLWSTDAYIQIFMFLARDSFVYEHAVRNSAMAIFKNVRQFEPSALMGYGLDGGIEYELIRDAFAWSLRTVVDANPKLIRLCEAVVLRDFGYAEQARRLVADGALNRKQGDGQYDHQLETIRAWGYGDLIGDAE
jgi:hypothetical protein